jgi:hypothetical protein
MGSSRGENSVNTGYDAGAGYCTGAADDLPTG